MFELKSHPSNSIQLVRKNRVFLSSANAASCNCCQSLLPVVSSSWIFYSKYILIDSRQPTTSSVNAFHSPFLLRLVSRHLALVGCRRIARAEKSTCWEEYKHAQRTSGRYHRESHKYIWKRSKRFHSFTTQDLTSPCRKPPG